MLLRLIRIIGATLLLIVPAGTNALLAQGPPASVNEFASLLGVAATRAGELAVAQAALERVQGDIVTFSAWRDRHNANQCMNTEGQPPVCGVYDAEAAQINARREVLGPQYDAALAAAGVARSRFGMSMARFRILSMLSELEAWRLRVVACADIAIVTTAERAIASARCLDREWERRP